ncbi:protein CC2D2B isoform X23 [Canis lupus familiaris]|uniref:protein CC2D2B isoform X23 n=1 Tax=Canis lupus familiaris TaxID=9615 RepID=UPI000BAA10EB|nr:protein CC2D2B isoform X23 [Canis lupus familiaris]XP_038434253.1 protein CC2D2B isoform X23 [Canis lupus familiaris]XP_048959416.1 protein CC2D2B isoform X25 [Canis lupus dingo]|eukprot:XP_022267709.1 protein CC2D2B isoform X17 [Canis lupus familiaris]
MMSEDNSAEENVDKHLQKDLDAEENQNVIETLRGKVREKLKNAKINQGEKSSTQLLIDDNVYHWPKTEVSLDEGLLFFMSSGEEGSTLDWYSEQRSINDSYSKHFSLGDHLQTFAEGQDEDFMEEVIFPDLFEVKAAEYEDDQEKIKKQQAYIFVPSSAPVVNQRKLPKDMIPRILEDEGFYIQRKPQIYKKTCNKMENRLLTLEEGKCWFEESGEIMSLPSPIRQSWNFRLNTNKGSLNPALKTTYRKAVKPDLESSIRNKMEGQREMYQLDLNIVGLQFSHHPLFNQEQVLCARLLQLYECFQDRQQQNLPQLLYEKLKALTDATKLANENPEIRQLTKKSLQDYYWQISDTKQLYDLERGKDFSLLHSILRTWKQIKFLRQQQGFTSTPVKLQFQRVLDLPTYLKSSISCLRHKETIKSVESDEILNEDTVQPFVEVSFQHTVYKTSTASGSHPCWNEEIKVDFISPGHDYSFSSLSKLKDNIYINIFDEMIIEKHEDPYFKSCSSHSHIRKNWLGSIVFPFSALLQQSEISGTFQVNIPPVLLGYTWSKTYVSPKEDNNGQNLKECIFLNIFATIEPQISYVTCNPELDKFSDLTDVLERAQIFKKTCKAMFPNRRITTTVFNSEGIQILVTRYIKALNPPQQFLDMFLHDSSATLDLIARFVSLIPIVPDILDENDGFDIWMTSERCISLAIGNKEEHAILLCNFFLYFGKKALVLLGTSMLEGQVAYVLTQETNEYLLWNPLTGQCHKQFDPFCPLQSVDCLFDDGNVWFNIQQNNTPMAVHFDYLKESFWKQLLPKNFQGTKPHTIQPEEIIYCETSKSMIEDLKNRIERTLKRKMMEWRPKQPTRWNRQCTYILRKILPTLELGTGSFVSSEEESEFERLLQLYWVTGFPIQMPYTDVESIIDAVYQTGIHSSEFPQTEFALAVYIHPYPNNILSVWVYLASLARYQ